MTVSTEYFDSVYAIKQASEQRISRLSANIAKADQKIELIKQRPLTAKRISRIERLETINASRSERIENFQDNITNYDAILPKDEFVPAYWVRDTGERWGVQVTVTDSPYDDTYIGGTTADLRLRGAGRITDYGVSGFGHTRVGESWLMTTPLLTALKLLVMAVELQLVIYRIILNSQLC